MNNCSIENISPLKRVGHYVLKQGEKILAGCDCIGMETYYVFLGEGLLAKKGDPRQYVPIGTTPMIDSDFRYVPIKGIDKMTYDFVKDVANSLQEGPVDRTKHART